MKPYSEKLKDQRWQDFRQRAFRHHGYQCEVCGEDKGYGDYHHVHHKRYIRGREPWEYSMDDVSILCRGCHDEVHESEDIFRNLIRQSPAWVAFHFKCAAVAMDGLGPDELVAVLSRAKIEARKFKYSRAADHGR